MNKNWISNEAVINTKRCIIIHVPTICARVIYIWNVYPASTAPIFNIHVWRVWGFSRALGHQLKCSLCRYTFQWAIWINISKLWNDKFTLIDEKNCIRMEEWPEEQITCLPANELQFIQPSLDVSIRMHNAYHVLHTLDLPFRANAV